MEVNEIYLSNEYERDHLINLHKKYPEVLQTEYTSSRLIGERFHISFSSLKDHLEDIPKYINHKRVILHMGPEPYSAKEFFEKSTIGIVFDDGHIEYVPPMTILDDLPPQNGQSILGVLKTNERLTIAKYAFHAKEMVFGTKKTNKLTVLVKIPPMPEITNSNDGPKIKLDMT